MLSRVVLDILFAETPFNLVSRFYGFSACDNCLYHKSSTASRFSPFGLMEAGTIRYINIHSNLNAHWFDKQHRSVHFVMAYMDTTTTDSIGVVIFHTRLHRRK